MQAHEVDLITMVQGSKQFIVPLYQRPYSWGRAQLDVLWQDVLAEAERVRDGVAGSGHFIGPVVLAPSPLANTALQQWLVVDGQQRLTTLMIALAAIRDHMQETDPEVAKRINVEYLVNQFHKGDEHLRLLLTQADRDAFRACIRRLPKADVGDGIGAAYRFFRSNLVDVDDPDDPTDVARLEMVIRQRLRLVEISAEPGDNVHRIFESLNNTGLKLSQADLLRNHLFMLLPTRSEQVYADVWLPMQRSLGANLELLMWLDLVLRGNDKAKQSDVYKEHAERLRRIERDEDAVVAEIAELARRSHHLAVLTNPELEPDGRVRRALERLNEWGGQVSYPCSMLLLDRREKGLLDATAVARGLSLMEGFVVRRMVVGVPTNNLNRILNAVPREIGGADDVVDALHRYLSAPRRYWPTDAAVRDAVRTKPFYWHGRGPQRSFVLRRIEESYESPEPVDWRLAKVTIEHVMPQKLNDIWSEQLSAEAAEAGLSVDELHDSLVHTLGNLTLSALNEPLSNHPFDKKREILERGALYMNREILDATRWGKVEIEARAARLAKRIIRLWPGPLGATGLPDGGRDWTQLNRSLALIPAGAWTTYGDLAEVVGSHPVPVGVYLSSKPAPNAWRVLTTEGRSSKQFRWLDASRSGTQQEALEAEGVTFTESGRASENQRLHAIDLARLLGLDIAEDRPPVSVDDTDEDAYTRFLAQLDAAQDPATAEGVRMLVDAWRKHGGVAVFGVASETTCFTVLRPPYLDARGIWPLAIYPQYGGVEVVFQHLARRLPFDDPSLRRELLDRLNAIAGIDLPEAKLALRPSFALDVFSDAQAVDDLIGVLAWFATMCEEYRPKGVAYPPPEGL